MKSLKEILTETISEVTNVDNSLSIVAFNPPVYSFHYHHHMDIINIVLRPGIIEWNSKNKTETRSYGVEDWSVIILDHLLLKEESKNKTKRALNYTISKEEGLNELAKSTVRSIVYTKMTLRDPENKSSYYNFSHQDNPFIHDQLEKVKHHFFDLISAGDYYTNKKNGIITFEEKPTLTTMDLALRPLQHFTFYLEGTT